MKKKTWTCWAWINTIKGIWLKSSYWPRYFTQYFNQSTNNTTFSGLPNIISQRESKGLSNGNFQPPYTANKHFSPKLVWMNNSRLILRLGGSCLKQEDTKHFIPSSVVSCCLWITFMAIRFKHWF